MKTSIHVGLTIEMFRKLKKESKETRVPRSAIIELALEEFFQRKERK